MDAGTKRALRGLKEGLLTLKETGDEGFEGLLAAVLSQVSGQPFRLASSGSQRGRDGDSAFDGGATYFEAKLYTGVVPKNVVTSKLVEMSVDDTGQVDTWVLCATSPISAQHADLYRRHLERIGIGCLILDWQNQTLPLLAAILAMEAGNTEQFLTAHGPDRSGLPRLGTHLETIAADSQFPDVASGLRELLREPALGLGIAKAANRRWLAATFSDRKRARQHFGQPLAPVDPAGLSWVARPGLTVPLKTAFVGTPDEAAFIVIGGEGAGKSWLVANTWLSSEPAPILVIFTADELELPRALHDLEGLFIQKFTEQTGTQLTDAAKIRWQRRFKGWRANANPTNVRFVVWVDGLNQAQAFPWPRWIDAAAKATTELGGRLIVTTNSEHFARGIRSVTVSQLRRIIVPEWSPDELRHILAGRKVDSDTLSAEVSNSLRNPRILGIAVELLDAKDIERLEELSVGRLLFEHMRRCQRDGTASIPASEFAKAMQDAADAILLRLANQQDDDLKLFDARLDDRLRAVSSSRFFAPVEGDPDLYRIKDDGLPLALGLSLIATLRKEHRNGRDPASRLSIILEPILALARTSEVVYAALLVACTEDECPSVIAAALVRYYTGIQNVPESERDAFEALARIAPEAFMQAARDAALFAGHLPNMQSLTRALLKARQDPEAWRLMSTHVVRWLSYYSLARHTTEVDEGLKALSEVERSFMDTRLERCDEGELADLHLLSLRLLGGMPLATFAEALVNWSFADALNPNRRAPANELQHLVQLNTMDWHATRQALLRACEPLVATDVSRVAERALAMILRATGEPEDAIRAEQIGRRLTKGRETFKGWRLVEDYCATDPCDPSSDYPENISDAAAAYEGIDVAALHVGTFRTQEDHVLSTAQAGLARFKSATAIAVHRRFARDVARREGLPRRQGVLSLVPSSAILESETVEQLIAAALASDADRADEDSERRDEWVTAQYSLFAALPHKSGNEQLHIIATLRVRLLLLRMLDTLVPADESAVEAWFGWVLQANDTDAQLRLLAFIHFSKSPLSDRARQGLKRLLASGDRRVRAEALAVVAIRRDDDLLKEVADSGWDAGSLEPDREQFELWHGSAALLAAGQAGILDPAQALGRMSVDFCGYAAASLGGEAARLAAARIDAALKSAAAFSTIPELPPIEKPVPDDMDGGPPLLSLVDDPEANDTRQFFERMNETAEAFDARQKRAWLVFGRFNRELTAADARLILDDVPWEGLNAIASAEPALACAWVDLLNRSGDGTVRLLHYFALGLAKAVAGHDTARAVSLLRRLSVQPALVNRVIGPSRLPAAAAAIWSTAGIPAIRQLCYERLDRAANDSALATEVLAAFTARRKNDIHEYVDQRLAAGEPAGIARALMVSGFSDINTHATATLASFAGQVGFIGRARNAAQYAYERNDWARHWFSKMHATDEPEEFWRCSVLLAKVVDGRFMLWSAANGVFSSVFQRFVPTIREDVMKRIEKWQDKRRRTLFGQSAPDPAFLTTAGDRLR